MAGHEGLGDFVFVPTGKRPLTVSSDFNLLRQRIFGLDCGYENDNDAARLAHDWRGRNPSES
jgi:hypothetical protein